MFLPLEGSFPEKIFTWATLPLLCSSSKFSPTLKFDFLVYDVDREPLATLEIEIYYSDSLLKNFEIDEE